MAAAAARQSAWRLRFSDLALEQRYRSAEDTKALRLMRMGLLVGAIFVLTASLLVLLIGRAAVQTLPTGLALNMTPWRFLQAVVAYTMGSALLYRATYTRLFQNKPQWAMAGLCIAGSAGLAGWLSILPLEFVAQRGFMFLVVHLFTVYGLLRMRLMPATVAGWGSMVMYMLVLQATTSMDATALARQLFWLLICNAWGMLICHQMEWAFRREFVAAQERDQAHARAEGLLLNILPAEIAARLKLAPGTVAEHAEAVTVLFADLVGFTPMAARKTPAQLVDLLDRVFTRFDLLAASHGLEKIKTIGDSYMAVAGLPKPQGDHALRAAQMALAMVESVGQLATETGENLKIRIGLHSGPVVAGVIGRSKFSYDLWGDTVNVSSRLESLSEPGQVHCSAQTASLLEGKVALVARGLVEVKGRGPMNTFYLAR